MYFVCGVGMAGTVGVAGTAGVVGTAVVALVIHMLVAFLLLMVVTTTPLTVVSMVATAQVADTKLRRCAIRLLIRNKEMHLSIAECISFVFSCY